MNDKPVAHTPTPWMVEKAPSWNLLEKRNSYTLKVTADGLTVAMMGMDQEANAAFIVRATNNFESLLTAAKEMRAEIARSHKGIVTTAWDKAINEAEK